MRGLILTNSGVEIDRTREHSLVVVLMRTGIVSKTMSKAHPSTGNLAGGCTSQLPLAWDDAEAMAIREARRVWNEESRENGSLLGEGSVAFRFRTSATVYRFVAFRLSGKPA